MLQTSLLLMKSLNKTETPIFLFVVCSLFSKAIFFTFIIFLMRFFFSFCKKFCTQYKKYKEIMVLRFQILL